MQKLAMTNVREREKESSIIVITTDPAINPAQDQDRVDELTRINLNFKFFKKIQNNIILI
jgi:hypothetical protein